MDTLDRKILPRKLNKRKKTNEKRYRPTKKPAPVSHIHTCLLHLFTEQFHVLRRHAHLTLFGVSAHVTFQHTPPPLPDLC